MKILIAEDEKITRTMLEHKLNNWGYTVESTADGNEAWETLQQKDAPKLILLDWMMPGMDGIDICRRLKKEPQTPSYVILLTSLNHEEDIVAGLDAGADDYITKPFNNSELRSRINVGRRVIELQAELIEKEKLQGIIEMAGAICHELNQPLQVVSGISELVTMDIEENNPLYEKMIMLQEQTERMGEITLKLTKITSYKTRKYLENKIVDIDQSSNEVL
jgi:DNA-binding response OmpR family regulator